MKNIFLPIAIATTALSLAVTTASTAQAANLIQNGSFEIGTDPGDFLPLNVGSTDITGWTVIRGGIDYYGTGWVAADGNRSLDLNGTPGVGGVSQTFSTNSGQQYQVTFALAGHPSGLLQTIGVAAAGQSTQFSFQSGTDAQNLGWENVSWLFTAVDTTTTLEFYSLQTSYEFGGPALDNVSVVRATSVPEPTSTVGLFVFCSLGLGLWQQKRKIGLSTKLW